MPKLAPFQLHGFELDRVAAVVLLECFKFSKRPEYSGGMIVSHLDGRIMRRVVNTVPIKTFIAHWTPGITAERKRNEAVELLINTGLLKKIVGYADNDIKQSRPIYNGVTLTPIGQGLAADLVSLLPERMNYTTFRELIGLAIRYRTARNDTTKRATILARIESLKTSAAKAA